MTLAACFRRFTVGSSPPASEVAQLHGAFLAGVRALDHCADLAPHPHVADELRHLDVDETSAAGRLAVTLKALGVPVPPVKDQLPIAEAWNHWGRLVRILDRQRELRARLLEAAIEHADTHPPLAALLDRLARERSGSIRRLRNLVAQADPHALD